MGQKVVHPNGKWPHHRVRIFEHHDLVRFFKNIASMASTYRLRHLDTPGPPQKL